jgi:hypothetical protein
MPDIVSRPYKPDPQRACPACCFGGKEPHAEWCPESSDEKCPECGIPRGWFHKFGCSRSRDARTLRIMRGSDAEGTPSANYNQINNAAVLAEREECAKIAESHGEKFALDVLNDGEQIAAKIRARGKVCS